MCSIQGEQQAGSALDHLRQARRLLCEAADETQLQIDELEARLRIQREAVEEIESVEHDLGSL